MNSDEAYTVIENIGLESGSEKQFLLRKYPDVQPNLKAAYDPYIHYYITKWMHGAGQEQFSHLTWLILEQLADRKLSGAEAQNVVNEHTRGLSWQSAELFNRILKKDLRMGMGTKTINKVFPGLIPVHDVMLAKLFDVNRLKFPCFGSPKIDGVRAKFKGGKFYSRNGHEYVGLGHLIDEIKGIDEELDGELIVHGRTFQESSGLIRNYDLTPNAEFHIFDVPTLKVPFIERLTIISDIDYVTSSCIKPVIHNPLQNKDQVMDYYDGCREIGYEGTVIKPYDYVYKGTRSYNWMKMKPTETVDLKVIDIYEGKGKYTKQMGGVEVLYKGKRNRVGGGWSDKQRNDFWCEPMDIINKTIEVWFMEETDEGNMRHARFIKFRGDKD